MGYQSDECVSAGFSVFRVCSCRGTRARARTGKHLKTIRVLFTLVRILCTFHRLSSELCVETGFRCNVL